jgi:hypothetical protein
MAQRGRPPKPAEQKRMLGNPGKRPLPESNEIQLLEPANETPTPDRPLGKPGLELWERVWESGASWISPHTDLELLLITCELVDERWSLRAQVLQGDDHRARRQLNDLTRIIIGNLSLLGFTPTDRSRLGVAEIKKQSKLEELIARRENR